MIQSPTEAPPSMGTGSLPDENTSEAILYGSAYGWIKSAMWAWDEIEDYYCRKITNLYNQLMDRRFCFETLKYNKFLIFARNPPVNNPDHLKDLMTLRELAKAKTAAKKIDEYRRQNLAWARKQGVQEYVRSLAGRGISEAEWKAATASYNMAPITYDWVHGITDDFDDEDFDWGEAMEDLMGEKAYNALVDKMTRGERVPPFMDPNFDRRIGRHIGNEDENEEEDEEPEVEEDPYWSSLTMVIEIIFDDPVQTLLDTAEPIIEDDCRKMAEWLVKANLDDSEIVDRVICFAREVEI